ncbi:MAG TPA: TIR domain-containing protein [Ktedonobacterales bacterium]|jgi:streptogramin lyase
MQDTPIFFISYSRKQFFVAKRLAELLDDQRFTMWLDVEQIAPGDNWQASIDRGLRDCRALVVVASKAAYRSAAVQYEVDAALKAGKPIYLAVIEPCEFTETLAGKASIINCRTNFPAAIHRLAGKLYQGQPMAESLPRPSLRTFINLPFGASKVGELLALSFCFLFASIFLALHIQITLHWPLDPRVATYLVLATILLLFWLLSIGYTIFLLVAFRYQRRVSFLELDTWPRLAIILLPMLTFFMGLRLETDAFGAVPGFGATFNASFSITYRSSGAVALIAVGFLALAMILFYFYARSLRHGTAYFVAAIFCSAAIMPSGESTIVTVLIMLVIAGAATIWILRETLSGKTIPAAFGKADEALQRQRRATIAHMYDELASTGAWGYWLSPGAFPRDPDAMMRPSIVPPRAIPAYGPTWRLRYAPADERCARKIRAILAQQPGIREATTSPASYDIALLSNRTPRRWIESLAASNPALIGIIVSSIVNEALPRTMHQNQWIDYRQQRPEPIRRLATLIAGNATTAMMVIPEDFVRPEGPFPFRLVSHMLRINGFLALVLALSALLIEVIFQVSAVPLALVVVGALLGVWGIWAGSRILARNITFAELCAVVALNLLNVGLWVMLGGGALLPRELKVSNGPYNQSLTDGVAVITLAVAVPLLLFTLFGLVEMLLHLRALYTWLPTTPLALRRTLAVAPWRQLDVAYILYALGCLVLIATVAGNAPARYKHTPEFDLLGSGTQVNALIPGPDNHLWFSVTTTSSQSSPLGQDALGWVAPDGASHTRFVLPVRAHCSAIVENVDCPFFFGKDGSLGYLSSNFLASPGTPPARVWLNADGGHRQVPLPANTLPVNATFDGGGNLWFLRQLSQTQLAISEIDAQGHVTDFSYQPTADIAAAPDGAIWLTDGLTHSLIRVGADGGARSFAPQELANASITQVAPAADGSVWFYDARGGQVGHILADGTLSLRAMPFQQTNAQLAVGAGDAVWLYVGARGQVVYLSPNGAPKTISLNATAASISISTAWFTVGGDGNLYFSIGRNIVRITEQGEQSQHELPTLNAKVQMMAADPTGTVWFSETPDPRPTVQWAIIGKFMA